MARSSILNVRPVLAEFQILVLACILIHQPCDMFTRSQRDKDIVNISRVKYRCERQRAVIQPVFFMMAEEGVCQGWP